LGFQFYFAHVWLSHSLIIFFYLKICALLAAILFGRCHQTRERIAIFIVLIFIELLLIQNHPVLSEIVEMEMEMDNNTKV